MGVCWRNFHFTSRMFWPQTVNQDVWAENLYSPYISLSPLSWRVVIARHATSWRYCVFVIIICSFCVLVTPLWLLHKNLSWNFFVCGDLNPCCVLKVLYYFFLYHFQGRAKTVQITNLKSPLTGLNKDNSYILLRISITSNTWRRVFTNYSQLSQSMSNSLDILLFPFSLANVLKVNLKCSKFAQISNVAWMNKIAAPRNKQMDIKAITIAIVYNIRPHTV